MLNDRKVGSHVTISFNIANTCEVDFCSKLCGKTFLTMVGLTRIRFWSPCNCPTKVLNNFDVILCIQRWMPTYLCLLAYFFGVVNGNLWTSWHCYAWADSLPLRAMVIALWPWARFWVFAFLGGCTLFSLQFGTWLCKPF